MKPGLSHRGIAAEDGGFTLLEILIAVALVSVVMAALYSTFSLSHRAMTGLDDSLIRLQESRMALDVMGRETESLFWKGGSTHHIFKLEDRDIYGRQTSRLTFTALSPYSPGISLISYYVEDRDGTFILFKEVRDPYRQKTERKAIEIMEGITSFTVEGFRDGKWLRTWDAGQTNMTPAEIRITITAPVKERPITFRETIRPKIGKAI